MLCGMAAATLEEILDALNDNADYDKVGSVSRAWDYVVAARRFLQLPSSSAEQGSSLGYTPAAIQEQITKAEAYIAANAATSSGSSSVRFLSASEGFRR
jgi:hypothetical protein